MPHAIAQSRTRVTTGGQTIGLSEDVAKANAEKVTPVPEDTTTEAATVVHPAE